MKTPRTIARSKSQTGDGSQESPTAAKLRVADFRDRLQDRAAVLLSGPLAPILSRERVARSAQSYRSGGQLGLAAHTTMMSIIPLGAVKVVNATFWPMMHCDLSHFLALRDDDYDDEEEDEPDHYSSVVFRSTSNDVIVWVNPAIEGIHGSGTRHPALPERDPTDKSSFGFTLGDKTIVVVYSDAKAFLTGKVTGEVLRLIEPQVRVVLGDTVDSMVRKAIIARMGDVQTRLNGAVKTAADLERRALAARADAHALSLVLDLVSRFGVDGVVEAMRRPSKHSLIESRQLLGAVVVSTTKPLVSEGQRDGYGRSYEPKYLGKYEIAIDFMAGAVRYRNIAPPLLRADHPHGSCLSGYSAHLSRAFGVLDVDAVEAAVVGFLSNFDADDYSARDVFATYPSALKQTRNHQPSGWVTLLGDEDGED